MRPALLILFSLIACDFPAPAEPPYFIRLSADRIEMLEGRVAEVSAVVSFPRGHLEAGLLSWHLSGFTQPGVVSVVVESRNDLHTLVHVIGFAGDSGYVVASQASSPPMDSVFVVVRPVSVATIRLDPDTLRVAVGEQGMLYPFIRDSAGVDLVRASLDWSVADTTVAVVDGSLGGGMSGSGRGLVRGRREGTTTVFATVEGVTDTGVVVVMP
jgi:hypothetical protein